MAAPLRKVVERELRHTGTTMSKRAGTITVTNHYRTIFKLDCGHHVEAPHSAPEASTKRCRQCAATDAKGGGA